MAPIRKQDLLPLLPPFITLGICLHLTAAARVTVCKVAANLKKNRNLVLPLLKDSTYSSDRYAIIRKRTKLLILERTPAAAAIIMW